MKKEQNKEKKDLQWKHQNAATFTQDNVFECDVVIVGSGAGGGAAAAVLAESGLEVIIVEEGPLKSTEDFKLIESEAYQSLYQESMARVTKDGGISILQGRAVGGSTTVNWTATFETPQKSLEHWKNKYGLMAASKSDLSQTFNEQKVIYNVSDWLIPSNKNNEKLKTGLEKLKIPYGAIQRNVKNCANLGYCGLGCPVGAKQGTLLTTIPSAMQAGATLLTKVRVKKLLHNNGTISELLGYAIKSNSQAKTGVKVSIKAKHFVLAGGAIGSPAIVKASKLDDPNGIVGKRTFLHPTVGVAALHDEIINPFYGAPQTTYSDAFQAKNPQTDPVGYKLETAPLHPILAANVLQGYGQDHSLQMSKLKNCSNIIALLIDGFHEESQGGQVFIRSDGTPGLEYEFTEYMWDGVKRAYLTMTEVMFASGATRVNPIHASTSGYSSWREARKRIPDLAYEMLESRLFAAHVMGGLPFGEDQSLTVCDSYGNYRYVSNLTVVDGSIFPTSVGTNPQLSIYTFATRNARNLAKTLRPS